VADRASQFAAPQVLAVVANVDAIVSTLTILLALCFVALAYRDESTFKREFDSKVKHADGSGTGVSHRPPVADTNMGASPARHEPQRIVRFSSKQGLMLKSKSSAGPLQANGRRTHDSTVAPPLANAIKDKRYFVLMDSGQLGWYRSPHDVRTKRPCEVVSLDVYSVAMTEAPTSPPAIALLPKDSAAGGTSKSWYFRASTPEETREWFVALQGSSPEQDDSSSDEA
jgi:hypothetical protein